MRRWLGWIALGCFGVHALGCIARGDSSDALWTCHMAVAALGVGLLIRSPRCASVGCLWIILGTPLWALDVACGAEFVPTSLATHVGGFVVAVLTIRSAGLASRTWLFAWFGGAALQQACRWLTDPVLNVNAAFEVYDRFRPLLNSYAAYLAALGIIGASCLWSCEYVLRRLVSQTDAAFWSDGAAT